MSTLRQEKVSEEIKKLSANFFEIEGNRTSLITVTRTEVSPDMKRGTVYLTIFPENMEETTMNFLKRKRKATSF
jgi:ribosome-binding factor A